LAEKGASVILACRSIDKAKTAEESIRTTVPTADIRISELDLSSLASIHAFATRIAGQVEKIDLLINSAGVLAPKKSITSDGFESQFVTNYLGHFLLAGLLFPLLARAPAARIVSLSSLAHRGANINFENLNAERGFSTVGAYAQSKLACLIFAVELQSRLTLKGSPVISTAAHPGVTKSDLIRNFGVFDFLARLVVQSTDAGAMPILRAATDPNASGGEYFGPRHLFALRGPAEREKLLPRVLDEGVATRLWNTSEQMSGIHYP
jgi:NAD(P)-dependent dehydrogenase (short-subunit alcohol dehydrogenase family)